MITFAPTPSISFRSPFRIRGLNRQHPLNRGLVECWNPGYLANGSKLYGMMGVRDGVITGATLQSDAERGQVLSFVDAASEVDTGANWISDFTQLTFRCWVFFTKTSGDQDLVCVGTHSGASALVVWRDEAATDTYAIIIGRQGVFYSASACVDNQWVHVAVVFTGSVNTRLYINGAEDGNSPFDSSAASVIGTSLTGTQLRFGTDYSGTKTLGGFLGSVAIHDRALSADEIRALYLHEADTYIYDSIPLAAAGGGITPAHFESAPLEAI